MKNGRFDRNDYYFQRTDPTPWVPISSEQDTMLVGLLKDVAKAILIIAVVLGAFVVTAGEAKADTWVAQAQDGGEIVLTERVCTYNGKQENALRAMYLIVKGGQVVEGCWALFDNKVQVVYSDDNSRWSYDVNRFVKRESY